MKNKIFGSNQESMKLRFSYPAIKVPARRGIPKRDDRGQVAMTIKKKQHPPDLQ
jgi:hypothetical protein